MLVIFTVAGNFAKFIDKGLCVSTERSDLLAKSPVRMTDKKILGILWDAGNFYRCRICLVNISVRMVNQRGT